MPRLIVVSFLFMAWAYYELSGGADFVPEPWPETVAEAAAIESLTNDDVEAAIAAAQAAPAAPEPAIADEVQVADPDPFPATQVVEPADAAEVTFVSLSDSLDGTALTAAEPRSESAATAPTPAPPNQPATSELRLVDATRLNVRAGPSTDDGVVGQLTRGEQVTLVSSNGDGWSLIRLEGDGLEGWVANRFLTGN